MAILRAQILGANFAPEKVETPKWPFWGTKKACPYLTPGFVSFIFSGARFLFSTGARKKLSP
jgi:hypothetical protein